MVEGCEGCFVLRKHRFLKLLVLLFLAVNAACQRVSASPTSQPDSVPIAQGTATAGSVQPNPTSPQLPAETPTDLPASVSATPVPTSAPASPLAQYTLKARYDHASHTVVVDQTIVYTNSTSENLANLVLLVEPNRYPGAFHLTNLALSYLPSPVGGGQAAFFAAALRDEPASFPSPSGGGEAAHLAAGVRALQDAFFLENNRLTVPLPQLLPPGGQVNLQISFVLTLPPIPEDSEEYKPVPFGYTARQANLVDWFPFLPPYREGQGWLAHNPWFFGEHQVYDVADYDVEIETSGSPDPLVLAASAQPVSVDGNTTRYHLEQARTFVISLSPYYQIYSQDVGGVTVYSYGLPYFEQGAQAALQYTAQALALYNQLYGPYPRRSLSVVVADFLDGMEYDGLYFLSRGFYNTYDGTPANYLAIIAVHETAHQWWYAQVGNDQALEPWLDEALCTYSERLFYERQYPELAEWWWSYRVNFYQPAGLVGGAVYDYPGFRPYRDAVYLRGALFLEALRQRVGDDAFFTFLPDYASRMAGRQAVAADFFSILADHSSADLSDLRQAYFQP